jgi:hypothetical protein
MNENKGQLFSRDWVEHSFKLLISRNIRERRQDERTFVEQATMKHRFQAMKSCIADARTYRVARILRPLASARFN